MGEASRRLDAANTVEVEAAFAAAPEEMVAEIIDGELSLIPRPAPKHTRAATMLGADLATLFDRGRGGPGGWVILFEPELHFGPGPDRLVPDIAGWRRDGFAAGAEGPLLEQCYRRAPDWVCEILSPSTERIDRQKKRNIYAREGVLHLWFLNPITRTLEVHRLEDGRYFLVGTHVEDEVVRAEPFEAVELALASLWSS